LALNYSERQDTHFKELLFGHIYLNFSTFELLKFELNEHYHCIKKISDHILDREHDGVV